jgi:hypothetical protein
MVSKFNMPFRIEVWDAKKRQMIKWRDKENNPKDENTVNSIHNSGIIGLTNSGMVFMGDDHIYVRYFTGKLDCDGNRIHKYDLLSHWDGYSSTNGVFGKVHSVVIWDEKDTGFLLKHYNKKTGKFGFLKFSDPTIQDAIVVGNIFENPELAPELTQQFEKGFIK